MRFPTYSLNAAFRRCVIMRMDTPRTTIARRSRNGFFALLLVLPLIHWTCRVHAQVPRGANQSRTENNLRQLGMAVQNYATDHNGDLPDKLEDLKPYLGSETAYK